VPSNASEAGSGTVATFALALPAMLAVNDEIVWPLSHPGLVLVHAVSDTGGVTLVRPKLMERGRPRVVMTSEAKEAVGANTAIEVEPTLVSAPSLKLPER